MKVTKFIASKADLACFSNRVTVVVDKFKRNKEDVVDGVARLVKMFGNRSGVDKMIVIGLIEDRTAVFTKAFINCLVKLALCFSVYCCLCYLPMG